MDFQSLLVKSGVLATGARWQMSRNMRGMFPDSDPLRSFGQHLGSDFSNFGICMPLPCIAIEISISDLCAATAFDIF